MYKITLSKGTLSHEDIFNKFNLYQSKVKMKKYIKLRLQNTANWNGPHTHTRLNFANVRVPDWPLCTSQVKCGTRIWHCKKNCMTENRIKNLLVALRVVHPLRCQISDINSVIRGGCALVPKQAQSWTVRTSRQRLLSQRAGCLQ